MLKKQKTVTNVYVGFVETRRGYSGGGRVVAVVADPEASKAATHGSGERSEREP